MVLYIKSLCKASQEWWDETAFPLLHVSPHSEFKLQKKLYPKLKLQHHNLNINRHLMNFLLLTVQTSQLFVKQAHNFQNTTP